MLLVRSLVVSGNIGSLSPGRFLVVAKRLGIVERFAGDCYKVGRESPDVGGGSPEAGLGIAGSCVGVGPSVRCKSPEGSL